MMAWHFWQIYLPRPRAFSRLWHGRHRCLEWKWRKRDGKSRVSRKSLQPQIMFWHRLSELLKIPLFLTEQVSESAAWHVCNHLLYRLSLCYIKTVIRWDTYLPAFLTNPTSASTAWQMSQQKQSGCQLLFMALMTRPMMNSPEGNNKWEINSTQVEAWLFQYLLGWDAIFGGGLYFLMSSSRVTTVLSIVFKVLMPFNCPFNFIRACLSLPGHVELYLNEAYVTLKCILGDLSFK